MNESSAVTKRGAFQTIGKGLFYFLVIVAGITANLPLPYCKYTFLAVIMILLAYTAFMMIKQKKILPFLKQNKTLFLFGIYISIVVTIKHIVAFFDAESQLSLITGYGEVLYALFGIIFFYMFLKESIFWFSAAYVLTFSITFLFTGRNTLYDYGNVCRTVGAFENPNVLALYGCMALFLSLLLASNSKRKGIYIIPLAISAAAIINTTSRAMYLALVASCVFFLFLVIILNRSALRDCAKFIKHNIILIVLFLLATVLFSYVYSPKIENATVDGTKGGLEKVLNEKETEEEMGQEDKVIEENVYKRLVSDDNSTEGSTVKNNTRFVIWKEYMSHLDEYIWGGNREGNDAMYFPDYGRNYMPHNMFISIFYKYGIVGIVLFVIILVKMLWTVLKERCAYLQRNLLFVGICTFIAYGMFHDLTNTGIFWVLIGMLYNCRQCGENYIGEESGL